MKFDSRRGDRGTVLDANGVKVPEPVAGDTETGRVLVLVTDAAGLPLVVLDGMEAVKEWRDFPPPLTVKDFLPGVPP